MRFPTSENCTPTSHRVRRSRRCWPPALSSAASRRKRSTYSSLRPCSLPTPRRSICLGLPMPAAGRSKPAKKCSRTCSPATAPAHRPATCSARDITTRSCLSRPSNRFVTRSPPIRAFPAHTASWARYTSACARTKKRRKSFGLPPNKTRKMRSPSTFWAACWYRASATPRACRIWRKHAASFRSEAEKELRLAAEQDPKDAVAVYFLGGLLVQSERYAEGVPYLEKARSLDPDSWATYLYLGKAKLKLHENADAVRYLEQAADMNHDEASVFYLLASALRATGRDQEAKAALRRVAELHTNSIELDRKMHEAMVAGAR